MPGAKTTLLIEGTFEELTDEFAQYIDSLKKSQGDESANLQAESAELLKENKKDRKRSAHVSRDTHVPGASARFVASPRRSLAPSLLVSRHLAFVLAPSSLHYG